MTDFDPDRRWLLPVSAIGFASHRNTVIQKRLHNNSGLLNGQDVWLGRLAAQTDKALLRIPGFAATTVALMRTTLHTFSLRLETPTDITPDGWVALESIPRQSLAETIYWSNPDRWKSLNNSFISHASLLSDSVPVANPSHPDCSSSAETIKGPL